MINSETIDQHRRDLGRELAKYRTAADHTQHEFAPMTGYGRSTIANVEAGRQNVGRSFWKRCDELLRANGELVRRYDELDELVRLRREQDRRQREAERDAQALASQTEHTAGTAELAERLEYVLKNPASTDLVAVAYLRERIQAVDARYDSAPSALLLAVAGQCHGQVEFLLKHSGDSRVRRELHTAQAESATLMGQLVWDASQRRDDATALAYLDQAITAAGLIHDPLAQAHARLRQSFVALYGQRDPRNGLAIAQDAARLGANASPTLAGMALLHVGEAHSMLGQSHECEEALSRAESLFNKITPADSASYLFSPTHLGRMAGSCYLFLNKPTRARTLLEPTATALVARKKSRAIVLGNLGLSHIRQRQLDAATAVLHRAIDEVELTRGGGGLNVIFSAGRELRPWHHHPAVQEIYDRMMALMATT